MLCCVCGYKTKGSQWYNRDVGYGICPDCAKTEKDELTEEEMLQSYGIEGLNYFIKGA